jgi:hypothetical protein
MGGRVDRVSSGLRAAWAAWQQARGHRAATQGSKLVEASSTRQARHAPTCSSSSYSSASTDGTFWASALADITPLMCDSTGRPASPAAASMLALLSSSGPGEFLPSWQRSWLTRHLLL